MEKSEWNDHYNEQFVEQTLANEADIDPAILLLGRKALEEGDDDNALGPITSRREHLRSLATSPQLLTYEEYEYVKAVLQHLDRDNLLVRTLRIATGRTQEAKDMTRSDSKVWRQPTLDELMQKTAQNIASMAPPGRPVWTDNTSGTAPDKGFFHRLLGR